jgi:hypothetical protein
LQQKKTGAVIVGIVLANLLTAGSVLYFAQMETPQWHVKPGVAMTYSIVVRGYSMHILGNNTTYGLPPFAAMNGSLMDLRVTTLPTLDDALDSRNFAMRVIEYLKTEQVGNFRRYDGTEIANSDFGIFNLAVSQCFLPVGAWALLDSFYPSEPEPGLVCQTYFSEMTEDCFVIGYVTSDGISGSGWFGEVNTETGVPSNVSCWGVQTYGEGMYSYSISMRLSI